MTTETPAPRSPSAASERVTLRTIGQRRRRVWRSALLVVFLALVMLVLSIMNRDQESIDSCRERMVYAVEAFQERLDKRLRSPSQLPLPTNQGQVSERFRDHYHYNWFYTESARTEVGVCCCQHPHSRLFGSAGRHVIIFNARHGKYTLQWMSEDEFVRRADELGLRGVLVRP